MSQQELLRRAVAALDAAGVDYMLTGSFVSSLQGEPRASHDIDLVVALNAAAVPALLNAFPPPTYYLDPESIRQALAATGTYRQFNLLEPAQGNKIDFWLLSDDEFDQARFAGKQLDEIDGLLVNVSRPEDTILMKLRWAELSGGSTRQFDDALRIYEVNFKQLDLAYMSAWAERLGLQDLWTRLTAEAKVVEP